LILIEQIDSSIYYNYYYRNSDLKNYYGKQNNKKNGQKGRYYYPDPKIDIIGIRKMYGIPIIDINRKK